MPKLYLILSLNNYMTPNQGYLLCRTGTHVTYRVISNALGIRGARAAFTADCLWGGPWVTGGHLLILTVSLRKQLPVFRTVFADCHIQRDISSEHPICLGEQSSLHRPLLQSTNISFSDCLSLFASNACNMLMSTFNHFCNESHLPYRQNLQPMKSTTVSKFSKNSQQLNEWFLSAKTL